MPDAMIESFHPDPYQWPKSRRIEATVRLRGEALVLDRVESRASITGEWVQRDRREIPTTLDELREWAGDDTPHVAGFYRRLVARAEVLLSERRKKIEAAADAGTFTVGVVSDTGGATWRVVITDALGRDQFFGGSTTRLKRYAHEGGSHPTYRLACKEAVEVHGRIRGPAKLNIPEIDQATIDRWRLGQSVRAVLSNP